MKTSHAPTDAKKEYGAEVPSFPFLRGAAILAPLRTPAHQPASDCCRGVTAPPLPIAGARHKKAKNKTSLCLGRILIIEF